MAGLFSRLFRSRGEPEGAEPARPPSPPSPAPEAPGWAGEEADLRRRIATLEVVFDLRTIPRERYEDELRRLERRLAELDP